MVRSPNFHRIFLILGRAPTNLSLGSSLNILSGLSAEASP